MDSDFGLFYKHVPLRFQGMPVRYIKLKKQDKVPFEKDWQLTRNYSISEIATWVADGNNYGIVSMDGTIVFIDADTEEIRKDLDSLATTLHYTTGKVGHMHYIYRTDQSFKNIPLKDGSYVKAKFGMIVGIGSVHPNGTIYGTIEMYDEPIATVKSEDLMKIVTKYAAVKEEPEENASQSTFVYDGAIRPPEDDIKAVVEDVLYIWKSANGQRHILALAVIGYLKRKQWDYASIKKVITTLVDMTGTGSEHIPQVKYCLEHKGKEYGYTTIQKIKNDVFSGA